MQVNLLVNKKVGGGGIQLTLLLDKTELGSLNRIFNGCFLSFLGGFLAIS